jgi:hypothetical protein
MLVEHRKQRQPREEKALEIGCDAKKDAEEGILQRKDGSHEDMCEKKAQVRRKNLERTKA